MEQCNKKVFPNCEIEILDFAKQDVITASSLPNQFGGITDLPEDDLTEFWDEEGNYHGN